MKVRIEVLLELCLHNQGVFRLSKQLTSSEEGKTWKTLCSTEAISGGTYLADLEPVQDQKVLEGPRDNSSLPARSSSQQMPATSLKRERCLPIAEDGTLLKQNDQ